MEKEVALTLLFTDIEGSTRIAKQLGAEFVELLEDHNRLIRDVVNDFEGVEVENPGDGFFIVFQDSLAALNAVIEMQQQLHRKVWSKQVEVKVRMALHYASIQHRSFGYAGIEIHRTSRICDSGHGGQVLLTGPFLQQIDSRQIKGKITKLGSYYLKDFEDPIELHQLDAPGMAIRYPILRTTSAEPVLAVLPFDNPNHDKNSDSLCKGIAEELIIALGRIPGLRLVSKSASFGLNGGNDKHLHTVADQLTASAILTGSLRRVGDQLSVNVELVDGGSSQNLWSNHYDGNMDELFAIQDDIREEVAHVMQVSSGVREIRDIAETQTRDIEAYEYYIKGRRFYEQFSLESIQFAKTMFERAISIDQEYALAYCGLSDCYSYMCMYYQSTNENLEKARTYGDKAIVLDPGMAEAWVSRGIAYSVTREYDKSNAAFRKAIELDAQLYEAAYQFARMTFAAGDYEKAAMYFEKAHSLRTDEYQALLLAGQCYEAIGLSQKALEVRSRGITHVEENLKLNPGDTRSLYMGANGLASLGSYKKALEWLQRALILLPNDAMLLYNAGCIYARCGMNDEAMTCIEKCITVGLNQRDWITNDPDLDSIRHMDRFKVLVKALNS